MRFRLRRLVLLWLAAVAVLARTTQAEGAIDIRASMARVDFPTGVTFSLDAAAADGITDVSLQLNTPGQRYGAYTRNVRPDFHAGDHVTATWTWRRFGDALPPGAEITYRWRVTGADGAIIETPLASVRVEDNRFQWSELRDGNVTVRWYRGGDDRGRALLDAATRAVRDASARQGVDIQRPVTIHVYASQNDLYSALPGTPPWIGGISIGEYDAVLVPYDERNADESRRALVHELTHQLIYQITFNPAVGSKLPAWLNEGMAVVSEGPTEPQNQRALDAAVRSGTLPTLRSLGGSFSSLPGAQAQLAYAASESVVRYLLATAGPDSIRSLLARFGEGRAADDALRLALGTSQDGVEDGWRQSLGLSPIDRSGNIPPQTSPRPAPPTTAVTRVVLLAVLAGTLALTLLFGGLGAALIVRAGRRR